MKKGSHHSESSRKVLSKINTSPVFLFVCKFCSKNIWLPGNKRNRARKFCSVNCSCNSGTRRGTHQSLEAREKTRNSMLSVCSDPDYIDKLRRCHLGLTWKVNPSKIGKPMLGHHHTEKTKAGIRETIKELGIRPPAWPKGKKRPAWVCEKLSKVPRTGEWKDKQRKAALETWQNSEIRQHRVEAIFKASARKPNLVEQEVLSMLGCMFPKVWQYVGDGQLIIGGKCPDFWNGNHKLIELYGDFWHKGQDPQKRIDSFARHGYKCLVIWEHELDNKITIGARIKEFVSEV